jgi:TPR repeat protein
VILEAIGQGDWRPARDNDHFQISMAANRELRTRRVKADRIMLDYMLPALRSLRHLFVLPVAWAKRLASERLWHVAGAMSAALVVAASASLVAVSLLPIDECDLLAASLADDLRIGPGNHFIDLRLYASQALRACRIAVKRAPVNGRYWYQLSRTLSVFDAAESLAAARFSTRLGYPAGYHALGLAYQLGEGVAVDLEQAEQYY